MQHYRGFVFLSLAVVIGLLATPSRSAAYVVYNADGTKTLTQDGWTLAGTPSDGGLVKSADFSSGQAASPPVHDGVWHINDNDAGGNAYMRMWKDPGLDTIPPPAGGIDQSQGLVIARAKYDSSSGSVNGTFGYSSTSGGHSIWVALRNGQVAFKTGQGSYSSDVPNQSVPGTNVWRTYALRWYLGGAFDFWYSATPDGQWSASQADWVQLVDHNAYPGGQWTTGQEPFRDGFNVAQNALLVGAYGGSSNDWAGGIDWIGWSKNSEQIVPWQFPGTVTPEPSTILLVAGGLAVFRRARR